MSEYLGRTNHICRWEVLGECVIKDLKNCNYPSEPCNDFEEVPKCTNCKHLGIEYGALPNCNKKNKLRLLDMDCDDDYEYGKNEYWKVKKGECE